MKRIFRSVEQTFEFGNDLASRLRGGEIILLSGEMGCGKTVFTKGLAKALGIKEEILSPTFTIMNTYAGEKLKLYHFDAYRIENISQIEEMGLFDFIGQSDAITVIEWPEILMPMLKNYKCIKVGFVYIDEFSREVTYDE